MTPKGHFKLTDLYITTKVFKIHFTKLAKGTKINIMYTKKRAFIIFSNPINIDYCSVWIIEVSVPSVVEDDKNLGSQFKNTCV